MSDAEDLIADTGRTAFVVAFYGSGWLVTHTVVPASARGVLTLLLGLVGVGAVLAGAYLVYGELSPGQCRALTNDGDRCSRTAGLGADCCWQHRSLHGVELVQEGGPDGSR